MSNHYKKLILLLIPACAGFCLALALGSAEEQPELCQLCQNKALVKEAILAFNEALPDANLPEQFDPNYVQCGATNSNGPHLYSHDLEFLVTLRGGPMSSVYFICIIAEGDMVAVHLEWSVWHGMGSLACRELATYRIANGKIIEGWSSRTEFVYYDY